ncbi:glutathione S-transferase family protein [Phenylobacterium sp.]|uniref:glutathione S-transferase family protein n=1 Tax=Phenylobacterium sp. TaxID=1871053 RepID=UPI0027257193|nr:glutathione S-transferase family protein [Phenylobacterium sp.]MDO8379035.1 glutathione S-transferase family protein [Phenylobacterium sp.]
MLKLYSFPGTVSLAVHIALEEAGADYELVPVDFLTNAQRSPEYLAINPKSRVPALVTERGVLTEAPALMTYVAQSFPQAGLAPLDDPFALAQVQAFNTYLCATVHVAAAHRHRGYRWADDPAAIADMRRKAPLNVAEHFELIEAEYLAGPWVMGQAYTICDPYLYTVAGWLKRDGIEIDRFPKVAAHFARMGERPAVRKVLAQLAA